MEKKKILFVSQEIMPYLPETEMSYIGRYLPQGIQERGREIRSFMPRYGLINERRNQLHEVIRLSGMNLIIDDTDRSLVIKVASIQSARMQVYFIDNEDYFHRKGMLSDKNGKHYDDNEERAIFFARGVLETVKKLRWSPDLVHCHGWFGCMVPLFLKNYFHEDPLFADTKIVYSLYNDTIEKEYSKSIGKKIGLKGIGKETQTFLQNPTHKNLMLQAIGLSDGIIKGNSLINPELEEYAKSKNKPILGYQSKETYIDAYSEFYNQVLSQKNGKVVDSANKKEPGKKAVVDR